MAAKKRTKSKKRYSYKGKYPDRIKEIGSTNKRGSIYVRTNRGERVVLSAKELGGAMPVLGESVNRYIMSTYDMEAFDMDNK